MKPEIALFFLAVLGVIQADAQSSAVREGNKLYREGRFEEAVSAYDEVLRRTPDDITAMYNRSNALARKGDKSTAMSGYDKLLEAVKDPKILQRSWYDKGVLHQQAQQLDESITAWKEALKLDPEDQQARENLQKALREKKRQQEEQKKDEPRDKKEQQKEQQKPQPQQSKLTQKQVEQLLKAMEQKEKEIQKKMQQRGGSPTQPEKDW